MTVKNYVSRVTGACLLGCCFLLCSPQSAQASPWAEHQGYFSKTGGKFLFGLRNSLLSWAAPWTEANEPVYRREWEGFCVGIGKTVVYTAAGLIQLATFPIPLDFPNVGLGMHVPDKRCPGRHYGSKKIARAQEEAVAEIEKQFL